MKKLDTCNVRTLIPGFSEDLDEVDVMFVRQKSSIWNQADCEWTSSLFYRRGRQLQDLSWKEISSFSGKENHQMKPGNMALVFTVRNTLLGSITSSADGSERGFSLQLHSSVVLVSLITAYAPILSSPGEAKDKLYHELAITIKGITEKELLTVHSR